MPRLFPSLLVLLCLSACALAKIDAIIDQYDTFGSTFGTTDENSSTTGADTDSSSTGSGTTEADTTDTSTAGAEASMSGTGTDTSTSDTSTSDTSSSSSTGPAPFCGDGIVDPDEEDCDDMNDNPNDGCKLCARDRHVFVSSLKWQGFKLDGLFGADQRCRMLAGQANLPNAFTYRAWLSDSTTPAADRILHSRGRYTLVNGLVVAQDWDALTSGALEIPLNVNEKSETAQGGQSIWTGTLPNGQQAFGSTFCNDWTGENSDDQLGGAGIRTFADSWWSFFEQSGCGIQSALYCIEN